MKTISKILKPLLLLATLAGSIYAHAATDSTGTTILNGVSSRFTSATTPAAAQSWGASLSDGNGGGINFGTLSIYGPPGGVVDVSGSASMPGSVTIPASGFTTVSVYSSSFRCGGDIQVKNQSTGQVIFYSVYPWTACVG